MILGFSSSWQTLSMVSNKTMSRSVFFPYLIFLMQMMALFLVLVKEFLLFTAAVYLHEKELMFWQALMRKNCFDSSH